MSINFPGTITGSAQTGLTSPTYTLSPDAAPDAFGIQRAVTGLGGTQTGVDSHSISRPFTLTWVRPKVYKVLDAVTGSTSRVIVGMNRYRLITRKGVLPMAGQPSKVMVIRTEIEVPAGADIADPANIRAALSAHVGALASMSAGLGDTLVTGVV